MIGLDGTVRRVRRDVILGTKREFPTKRLAQRRLDAVLARINGLDYRASRVATFDEFLERWKEEILPSQKPSSRRAVRSHLKMYIVPELGKVRLEQFGVENQQTFIARMAVRASKKAVSRKTVLNVLGTLSTILTTARDWGHSCSELDTSKLHLPARGMKCEARLFTVEQLQKILAIAEEPWRTLYCILTFDGLRAGEALGLKWDDIDLDRSLLHVRRSAWYGHLQTAKSEGSETVLAIPEALATVLKNPERSGSQTRKIFCSSPATADRRPPTKSWNIICGHCRKRSEFHGAGFTHSGTLTRRYCWILVPVPKSLNANCATPMRGPRSRFTGM